MKKYFEVLRKCSLFDSISDDYLPAMLTCFGVSIQTYAKDETIVSEGTPAKYLGIVLSGEAQIIRIDYYGNRSIMASLSPSQLFGESYACAEIDAIPVDIVATEKTEIMMIDVHKITRPCANSCEFHKQMIFNLVKAVAMQNLVFHQKIEITSKRSTREKLITYLLSEAKKNKSDRFTVPYDRQELADYLEVERSGLSTEIGKLKREGALDCEKNRFVLLSGFPASKEDFTFASYF